MVTTLPEGSNEADAGELPAAPVPTDVGDALSTVHEALENADLYYGHGTNNDWDEAVLLVLSACGLPADASDEVMAQPVSQRAWETARGWVKARITTRVPLPYLIGRAWFAGLEFRCDARALVPRSPLAEVIRDHYAPWYVGEPKSLLDLCCGGGCIGIAAARYQADLRVVLADIDSEALALARENIARHDVAARVTARESDLYDALASQRFDVILSNPPYVDAPDLQAMPPEYQAEPARGLGAGVDGLDLARRILARARLHLNPGGVLFLELGNSWMALDSQLQALPLTWLEFRDGGHGVLVLREDELPAVEQALLAQAAG